jgi:hypothetical protein
MTENDKNDTAFAHELLKGLPTVPVPAALEARILADFDRLALAPRKGVLARLGDRLWPGVPAWKPASVLALSLAMGLMAGVFVPSSAITVTDTTSVTVITLDTVSDLDFDRDQ